MNDKNRKAMYAKKFKGSIPVHKEGSKLAPNVKVTIKRKLNLSKIRIGDIVDYGWGKGKVTHIKNDYDTQSPLAFKVNGKYHSNLKNIKLMKKESQ